MLVRDFWVSLCVWFGIVKIVRVCVCVCWCHDVTVCVCVCARAHTDVILYVCRCMLSSVVAAVTVINMSVGSNEWHWPFQPTWFPASSVLGILSAKPACHIHVHTCACVVCTSSCWLKRTLTEDAGWPENYVKNAARFRVQSAWGFCLQDLYGGAVTCYDFMPHEHFFASCLSFLGSSHVGS